MCFVSFEFLKNPSLFFAASKSSFSLSFPVFFHLEDSRCRGGNLGPEVSSLLGHRAGDRRPLHLTLGVDDDTSIVLKVDEAAVHTSPGLALADDDCGVDLLAELGLALLAGGEHHVADTRGGETVEAALDVLDSDEGEGLGTSVVGAVDGGRNGKTARNFQLAGDTGRSLGGHLLLMGWVCCYWIYYINNNKFYISFNFVIFYIFPCNYFFPKYKPLHWKKSFRTFDKALIA